VESVVLGREEVVLHHIEADEAVLIRLIQLARVASEGLVADQGPSARSLVYIVGRPLGGILYFDRGMDGGQLGLGQEVVDEGGEVGFGSHELGDEAARRGIR
jgi:hypothetical protein